METLARLHETPDWALWLIGGPADDAQATFFETLRAAAESGGIASRVQFLGQRDDVPDELLQRPTFFSLPPT